MRHTGLPILFMAHISPSFLPPQQHHNLQERGEHKALLNRGRTKGPLKQHRISLPDIWRCCAVSQAKCDESSAQKPRSVWAQRAKEVHNGVSPPWHSDNLLFLHSHFLNSHFSPEYPTDGNSSWESARLALPAPMKGAVCCPDWASLAAPDNPTGGCHIPSQCLQSSTLHLSTLTQFCWAAFSARTSQQTLLSITASWDGFRVLQTHSSAAFTAPLEALPNCWETLTSLCKSGV